MRRVLPFTFRAHHQLLGREMIQLHGAVALLYLLQPELFTAQAMAGDVETRGVLTKGATIFDRRSQPLWRKNMEVAMEIDAAAARDAIVAGWKEAGRQS